MKFNWFTLASLLGFIATGGLTIMVVAETNAPYSYLIGITGLAAMTITAAVLSLHFKDD